MEFRSLPIDEALGHVLGHNVAGDEGRRRLRKGKPLGTEDIELLRRLGRGTVWVAVLDEDDVGEDEAARRIASAVCGEHLETSRGRTGRVNVLAGRRGLLRVDVERLLDLNGIDGVTLATLPSHAPVAEGKMVATLKILPYALTESVVAAAESLGTVLSLTPLPAKRCGLVLCGSASAEARVARGFEQALGRRLENLGASLDEVVYVPVDEDALERLAEALRGCVGSGLDLVLLAGETAIQDRDDLAPRAVEEAGAVVESYGAPVDPGNLLLLAYHGDVPIVGAPGCARSPKTNIVDLVLPRLLAGDRLRRRDVLALGHGGLLDDVPERPLPRSRIE